MQRLCVRPCIAAEAALIFLCVLPVPAAASSFFLTHQRYTSMSPVAARLAPLDCSCTVQRSFFVLFASLKLCAPVIASGRHACKLQPGRLLRKMYNPPPLMRDRYEECFSRGIAYCMLTLRPRAFGTPTHGPLWRGCRPVCVETGRQYSEYPPRVPAWTQAAGFLACCSA